MGFRKYYPSLELRQTCGVVRLFEVLRSRGSGKDSPRFKKNFCYDKIKKERDSAKSRSLIGNFVFHPHKTFYLKQNRNSRVRTLEGFARESSPPIY